MSGTETGDRGGRVVRRDGREGVVEVAAIFDIVWST